MEVQFAAPLRQVEFGFNTGYHDLGRLPVAWHGRTLLESFCSALTASSARLVAHPDWRGGQDRALPTSTDGRAELAFSAAEGRSKMPKIKSLVTLD